VEELQLQMFRGGSLPQPVSNDSAVASFIDSLGTGTWRTWINTYSNYKIFLEVEILEIKVGEKIDRQELLACFTLDSIGGMALSMLKVSTNLFLYFWEE